MDHRRTHNVERELFSVGERRQSGGVGHASSSLRTAAIVPSARDFQIVDSTLSVVGGDVVHNHNHHHYEHSRDIWALLQSIPNFRNTYLDMLSKATPGTGMWLLKGDKFRLWLEPNGDIKIFWGSGIPGAGKTLLACIVIEHLEALRQESDGNICVCYIYFRYSERGEVTVRNILESLVKQTLERHPDFRTVIEQIYTQHLREGTEPTEAQLLGLLQQLNEGVSATFYILDALDEALSKIQLAIVKALASLKVKLFITSRPLATVEAYFPQAHTFTIVAQDADLDLCITKGIDESPDLQHLLRQANSSLREEVFSTVKQNCGGMFLHAALQLDALSECLNARDVRATLSAFPTRIKDVYRQTWARICNQGLNHTCTAKAVLVWVLNASRSMTIEELQHAVATCPETHKFKSDLLVPGATLISLCRGLVTIEEENRLVRLVHYTAKDALEKLLRESYPHPQSYLAAVCMAHLTECGFQNTMIESEKELRAALKKDPLLAYASGAWALHARAGLDDDASERRTAQFISEIQAFPAFVSPNGTSRFDIVTPLHIGSLYRLPPSLRMDSITGNPNARTKLYQETPLMVASGFGHEGFVAHLLTLSDIDINLADVDGCSALMLATWYRRKGVVQLLVAHPKVQVNLVDSHGHSALILAAKRGCEGVVKLLLTHPEIQVDLVNSDGWSALMWAALVGREDIVALLLAYPEVPVNLVGRDGRSALAWAAYWGHEGVVKLLLMHPDIQVNLVTDCGFSALMLAAIGGFEGVVKLPLKHPDTQVNLVENHGWSALILTVSQGHEGVVRLLLESPHAQANPVDNDGWSALMVAASEGHEGVVLLLLAHPETHVNLANYHGSTALLLAAQYGRTAVVELLLTTGALDVNTSDNDGDTAIKMAAQMGHEAIVRLLLDVPNVDIKIRSVADGHTAMSAAQANGHDGIVGLLKILELRKAVTEGPLDIDQLSVSDDSIEGGSDSNSSDCCFDAEETLGEEDVEVVVA